MKEYIEQRVNDQIEWYDTKARASQKWYKRLQITEIVLASMIPLLSGYSSDIKYMPFIVGTFGVAIAVIGSISKLNRYHENWIEYRTSCEMLKSQKQLYLTESYPYNSGTETKENIFVRNIENIITSENSHWEKINVNQENTDSQEDPG